MFWLKYQSRKFLVILIIALLAGVLFASLRLKGVIKIWKEDHVAAIDVVQDGSSLELSWNDIQSGEYRLEISKEGEKVLETGLKDNKYTLNDIEFRKNYDIVVYGKNNDGDFINSPVETFYTREPQTIGLALEEAGGHKGDVIDLAPETTHPLTFTSSNEEIAIVDETGKISLLSIGKARVTISAEGDDDTLPEVVEISAICFPEKLDTPVIKIKKQSATEVQFSISGSLFDDKYELMKKVPGTDKYEVYRKLNAGEKDSRTGILTVTIPKEIGDYAVRSKARAGEIRMVSERSKPVTVKSGLDKAKTYGSITVIKTLSGDEIDTVATTTGGDGAGVAQSMCCTEDSYIVAMVNRGNSVGRLEKISKEDGSLTASAPTGHIGHANGCTYDPHTNSIYVMKTYASAKYHDIPAFDAETLESKGPVNFGTAPSGIGYDAQTDQFYLTASSRIYVTDGSLGMRKTLYRKRDQRSQDVCGFNGIIMSCIWTGGSGSYIDMYRESDGAYVGSIAAPFGEIESACVDDGYLVMLFNGGYIYKTKARVDFPG